MKKTFEKLITIALGVVSLIFVVFSIIVAINTNVAIEANNSVVRALFFVFAIIFAVLTALNILMAFNESERVNQILLFKTKDNVKKASVSVIRKMAKQVCARLDGIKICHIQLFADANSEVTMKAAIKLFPRKDGIQQNVSEALETVNTELVHEYKEALGYTFKSIELQLVSLKLPPQPQEPLATPVALPEQLTTEQIKAFSDSLKQKKPINEPIQDIQPIQEIEPIQEVDFTQMPEPLDMPEPEPTPEITIPEAIQPETPQTPQQPEFLDAPLAKPNGKGKKSQPVDPVGFDEVPLNNVTEAPPQADFEFEPATNEKEQDGTFDFAPAEYNKETPTDKK